MSVARVICVAGCITAVFGSVDAVAAKYKEIEVTDGAVVSGMVTSGGAAPKLHPHPVTKDAHACGSTAPNESYLIGANGGLANVVVRIEKIKAGKKLDRSDGVLDQVGCSYVPHVSVRTLGTKLVLKNSDPVLHNSHTYMGTRTLFNLALPTKGVQIPKRLTKPGLVKFTCDAGHTWMSAWVWVSPHPYATVTDGEGRFTISDVPAGRYKLVFWHEVAGEIKERVEVSAGAAVTVNVEMTAESGV